MTIDVKRIAKLSAISVNENEEEKIRRDMEDIIRMFNELPELDEMQIREEPTAMNLREDKYFESDISAEELLKAAPMTRKNCFVVPKTIGQVKE